MVALLASCGREQAPAVQSPAPQPPRPAAASPQAHASSGEVSIHGDDALADVLSWTLPNVEISQPEHARAQARRALQEGDLFETEHSAIPLLMALRKLQPDNVGDQELLGRARAALLAQANIALDASEDPASLRYAQRMGNVLRTLWPDMKEVGDYLAKVDRAERAFDMTNRGYTLLRSGRLDDPAGALVTFRAAQALWPQQIASAQGIAAVEALLIARAQTRAQAGDIAGAEALLKRARNVRNDPRTLAVARGRVEVARVENDEPAGGVEDVGDDGIGPVPVADGRREDGPQPGLVGQVEQGPGLPHAAGGAVGTVVEDHVERHRFGGQQAQPPGEQGAGQVEAAA